MPTYRCRNCQRPTTIRWHIEPPYDYCFNYDPLMASEDPAGAVAAGATKMCDPYEVVELHIKNETELSDKLMEVALELFVAKGLLRRSAAALELLMAGENLAREIDSFLGGHHDESD